MEQLYVIWGAKEVLFKMFHNYTHTGNNTISFKNNFWVEPFVLSSKGIIGVRVEGIEHSSKFITLEYMKINNYILVYPAFN